MADCFDNLDPSSCEGLGTRIKNIQVSGGTSTPPVRIDFDIGGWSVYSACLYQVTILASTHQKGVNPMAQVEKDVAGLWAEVGVEKVFSANGTLNLRVVRNPDCRFKGRAIIG